MKKITTVQSLDHKIRTLAEVAGFHWNNINKINKSPNGGIVGVDGKRYDKNSLINQILKLKKEIKDNGLNTPIFGTIEATMDFILDEGNAYQRLKSIVIGEPAILKQIITEFKDFETQHSINFVDFSIVLIKGDKKTQKSVNLISEIFDYEAWRVKVKNKKPMPHILAMQMNIKVCPYCNNQYTQTLEKQDKTHKVQFQLDHFYPQSIYPYLAVSFYNLIPSCNNCNLSKSNHDTFKEKLIHPYEESFHQLAKFRTNKISDINLIKDFLEKGDFRTKNIDIELVSSDARVQIHKNIFHLEDIYKQHQDVVSEIYAKSYLYPSTRIAELSSMFDETKLSLFSEDEIKRFILGNYIDENDFHLRPLSKLTHDIAQELGLL